MADTAKVTAQNGEELEETKSPVKTVEKAENSSETKEQEEKEAVDSITNDEKEEKKVEITPELERKIIRQMEFYFGDLNLARDRFMQGEIRENDGWLTMETMLKFNRLKNLCEDVEKIVEAVKKSTSGLLEFSEDGKKVRRNPSKPVPSNTEERRADLKSRTCYAKNFPQNYGMGDLLDFFDQHCSTELIQMRRNAKKEFKGSVFVVFPTKEEAKKFLALKELKIEDGETIIKMLKDDYFQYKMEEKKKAKKPDTGAQEKKKKEAALEEEEKLIREKMTKGAVLHLVGISSETKRDDIKEAFGGVDSKIAWIDYDKGDSDAWVRFDDENGAKAAWDTYSTDEKITINDHEIRADVLEGEVELNHWKNIFQARVDKGRRGFRSRSRGRGGKGRRSGRDDDGPSYKRARRD